MEGRVKIWKESEWERSTHILESTDGEICQIIKEKNPSKQGHSHSKEHR
jgi:hypothetical protein